MWLRLAASLAASLCAVGGGAISTEVVGGDIAIGIVGHEHAHRRLAFSAATWLRQERVRFFSNASEKRFGGRLVRLPDDAQLADDPLHSNPGEARFIPGLLHLVRFLPARWYILADDDTFLVLPRLREALAQYDPRQPWFFGSASVMPFASCDGKGECSVPLRIRGRRTAWRQPRLGGRRPLCFADPAQDPCPPAELDGVGSWCEVSPDASQPYGFRIVGGFLPQAREALFDHGVGPEGLRRLDAPIDAPPVGGAGEFPLVVWPVGGLGMIISAGAVDRLAPWQWAACVRELRCGPGDMRLSSCLARFAGAGLSELPGLGTELSRHKVQTDKEFLSLQAESAAR